MDSLGSVSGRVSFGPGVDSAGTTHLLFRPVTGSVVFEKVPEGESFNYSLPPGKYFLSGFLDNNNNGRHDFGNLYPFAFAEKATIHPDTIRVRARFETADIEFIFE